MWGKIKKVAFEYYYVLVTILLGVPVIAILMLMLLARYVLIVLGIAMALLTAGVNLKDKKHQKTTSKWLLKMYSCLSLVVTRLGNLVRGGGVGWKKN